MATGFRAFSNYSGESVNKFDFYSGSQITVWFGDVLIDDVYSIQWERTQNKRPLYGYASQQFDAVADGTVLTQGIFTVNFRQTGYLSLVTANIKKLYGNLESKRYWPEVKKLIGLHLKNGTFGPQSAQDLQDIGNDPQFLQIAQAYEDSIWGGGVPGDDGSGVSDQMEKLLPPDVQQSRDIPDGFNIIITYGNVSGLEATTLRDQMQSTTKSLSGVHLVGESQVIQVGGDPVMEQYSFIARGTDEYAGTTS